MRVLELTEKEFELIQEGLDSLPKMKGVSFDTATLAVRIMVKNAPQAAKENFEEMLVEKQTEHEKELKQLENRIVMVKAKLLSWREE